VAAGAANGLSIQNTPNFASAENDLFATTTAADGSTWAVGWDLDTTPDLHEPLILQGANGTGSLVSSPSTASCEADRTETVGPGKTIFVPAGTAQAYTAGERTRYLIACCPRIGVYSHS
jgi:hypothetical protein